MRTRRSLTNGFYSRLFCVRWEYRRAYPSLYTAASSPANPIVASECTREQIKKTKTKFRARRSPKLRTVYGERNNFTSSTRNKAISTRDCFAIRSLDKCRLLFVGIRAIVSATRVRGKKIKRRTKRGYVCVCVYVYAYTRGQEFFFSPDRTERSSC